MREGGGLGEEKAWERHLTSAEQPDGEYLLFIY